MRFIALLSLVLLLYGCGNKSATSSFSTKDNQLWKIVTIDKLPKGESIIAAEKFDCYLLNTELLQEKFKTEKPIIDLPIGKNSVVFQLEPSNTMNPALAAKFPEIKSYKGKSTDQSYSARVDQNEQGLFVQIVSAENKLLISPLLKEQSQYYAVYRESDIPLDKRPKIFID